MIEALGPDGTLVYRKNNSVYATRAPYTGTHLRVSRNWRDTVEITPTVFFRGPELVMLIGRTAFRVSY